MFLFICVTLLVTFAAAALGDCDAGGLDCSGHCVNHEFAESPGCRGFPTCAYRGTRRERLSCFCPRACGFGRRSLGSSFLTFVQRRKSVQMKKKRHDQALESLEEILSQDISLEARQEELSVVFALVDTDENGVLSNKERQFLFKDVVNNAVELIFGDAQTLTVEEWCAVEFDVVPRKLAPSSAAEQQMICQWEEDVIVDDCAFDFQLLTEGEVLSRGQMADYYYTVLNPAQDWNPAQFEAYLFNSKRDPLQKIFASQTMQVSNVDTVTTNVNDCAGVVTRRRSLQETSIPLVTSIMSNLASTDDCEFTNCPELHGVLGMLQHNSFCEEGIKENCIWTQNLLMPSH